MRSIKNTLSAKGLEEYNGFDLSGAGMNKKERIPTHAAVNRLHSSHQIVFSL